MNPTLEEQVYDILIQYHHLRLDHTKDCHKLAREVTAGLENAFEERYQNGFDDGIEWNADQ